MNPIGKNKQTGYTLPMDPYVVVVGGTNQDICGKSTKPLVCRDSNPGTVWATLGGVGHNIALNMAKLGLSVFFITAVGDDDAGRAVLTEADQCGLHLVLPPFHGASTGRYVYLCGPDGNMELAVNDMQATTLLTPQSLAPCERLVRDASLVVAEANLQPETLRYVGGICDRLVVDPVSTIKMGRLEGMWDRISVFKPNRLEAEMLSHVSIDSPENLNKACTALLALGMKSVVVSLGEDGACYADSKRFIRLPVIMGNDVVDTTGCGDAFVAGFCFGLMEKGIDSVRYALASALGASSITATCEETVNPHLDRNALIDVLDAHTTYWEGAMI